MAISGVPGSGRALQLLLLLLAALCAVSWQEHSGVHHPGHSRRAHTFKAAQPAVRQPGSAEAQEAGIHRDAAGTAAKKEAGAGRMLVNSNPEQAAYSTDELDRLAEEYGDVTAPLEIQIQADQTVHVTGKALSSAKQRDLEAARHRAATGNAAGHVKAHAFQGEMSAVQSSSEPEPSKHVPVHVEVSPMLAASCGIACNACCMQQACALAC